jgi:hypothetical protein
MAWTISVFFATTSEVERLEQAFRAALGDRSPDAAAYYIKFRAADADDAEFARVASFTREATVCATVQPPRGHSDAPHDLALLKTADYTGSSLIVLHDDLPLYVYVDGVLHLPPNEREYYEREVLPFFGGVVQWDFNQDAG